jgi:hypothetical protein
MTIPVLGVDPGSTSGGAALLSPCGARLTGWLAWTWLKAGGGRYRLTGAGGAGAARLPGHHEVPHLHAVGALLAELGPYRLVLEGLFLAHGSSVAAKGKRKSLLPLAEAAGEILGPLRTRAVGPPLRPNAQREWRPRVLGLPHDAGDKEAEERAVTWARRNLEWVAPLPRHGLSYAEEGAVCEAACMAVLGWREAQEPARAAS